MAKKIEENYAGYVGIKLLWLVQNVHLKIKIMMHYVSQSAFRKNI